jgi:hypothetical protein
MSHLQAYRNREGKYVVQLQESYAGILYWLTYKSKRKMFRKAPSDFVEVSAPTGEEFVRRALEGKLSETDRRVLERALNSSGEKIERNREPFDGNRRILTIKPDVKKRQPAQGRFQLYKLGMTLNEYVALGGTIRDTFIDIHRGNITVTDNRRIR